jgi:hypothetical protein
VKSTVSQAAQLLALSLTLGFAVPSQAPKEEKAIVETRPSTTATCRAQDVRRRVMRFVASANGRERLALVDLIADDGLFQWFTIDDRNPRRSVGFYRRRPLLRYLSGRRDGANYRLLSFVFNGRGAAYGHFEYRLAVALPRARLLYNGKGAVTCQTPHRIAVWSMGNA